MSMASGAHILQTLYESGSISYPRSDAEAVSPATAAMLAGVAERFGVDFDPGRLPVFAVSEQTPHEALHPLNEAARVAQLNIPTRMLNPADRVLQAMTRSWLRRGSALVVDRPEVSTLPAWAQALQWSRPADSASPLWFDAERHVEPGLMVYSAEMIALQNLMVADLGRPSSLASHATHAGERGVVSSDGLTFTGRTLLAHAPPELRSPANAKSIEEAIVDPRPAGEATNANPLMQRLAAVFERVLAPLKPRFARALVQSESHDDVEAPVAATDAIRSTVSARRFVWPWEADEDADVQADVETAERVRLDVAFTRVAEDTLKRATEAHRSAHVRFQ